MDTKTATEAADQLIAQSEVHGIARATWTQELHDALVAACDDWCDTNDGGDYWACDSDTSDKMTWRVELHSSPERLLAALSDLDRGDGCLAIIVAQALRDDPEVTAADVRAIVLEAETDAEAERNAYPTTRGARPMTFVPDHGRTYTLETEDESMRAEDVPGADVLELARNAARMFKQPIHIIVRTRPFEVTYTIEPESEGAQSL